MARVPYLDADQIPADQPNVLARIERERGSAPNVYRALANVPHIADKLRDVSLALRNDTELPPALRELAILTVVSSAGSRYELIHHQPMALKVGVTQAQLDGLAEFETSAAFSDLERAVIRYAREATLDVEVSDLTWEAVTTHLSQAEALGLVLNVAWYNNSVRIMVPLQIELEPEYTA